MHVSKSEIINQKLSPPIMIAWALSGGGNRGPLQVGAMRALFERGIKPNMLVGTSAGALNSAFLATDPTAETNERLAQIWLETRGRDIFPKPRWLMLLRAALAGNGMDDNKARTRSFLKWMPPEIRTFGDLKARLYLTTADLQTGRLYLFGDDPKASLLEAALCSTALPVVWDPELIGGHQYVDGGVVANVPISIALDKGANVIFALDLQDPGPYPLQKGVISIAMHTIGVLNYQQVLRDIQRALHREKVTLYYISLGDLCKGIPLEDFSHTAEMIQVGYQRTKEYLKHPTPNILPAESLGVFALEGNGNGAPPGAVPYQPRF